MSQGKQLTLNCSLLPTLLCVSFFSFPAWSADTSKANTSKTDHAAASLNSVGVAFMNQQVPGKALVKFEDAHRADSSSAIPLINKGIALIYLRRLPEAEQALKAASVLDPKNPRVWYSLGLALFDSGDQPSALKAFERAAELDPQDADTHYYIGIINLGLKDYERAIPEFEKALQIRPLHASAQYGLARALQRSGKADEARKHVQRFQEITQSKIGTIFSDNYGEQGHYATAEDMPGPPAAVSAMIPVTFALAPAEIGTAQTDQDSSPMNGGACIIDLEGTGRKDIVAMQSGANAIHAYRIAQDGTSTTIDAKRTGLALPGKGIACAVGDYDNDGLPDLAIALEDRIAIFHNLGHGKFADTTSAVGIRSMNHSSGLTFVDFDHDGDLDLFITGSASSAGIGPNILWRNNGNSTFTEWTSPTGLAGETQSADAVLSDINNDRAVDLVVTGHGAPTIFENQREGAFRQIALYDDGALPATRGVSTLDFNKDGWMDVAVTHAGAPGLTLWKNVEGKHFERVSLPLRDVTGAWGLTPIDFDNDGWIDLAVIVETSRGARLRLSDPRRPL